MNDVHHILKAKFGYDSFRAGQREIIGAILSGRDCVGVMPTGAGKSLCYQVPALALPGITLVISPLVSLMHDQVNALVHAGIPAAFLNSQLAYFERDEVMWRASNGEYKLLYVAPERLTDPAFVSFARDTNIPLVAVDEAHCVSQWGQDFRPSYLGISRFIEQLGDRARPVVAAFTATATPLVARDIARLLELRDPFTLTTGFDRPNLRFEVEQLSDKRKKDRLASLVREHQGESGIVYCSTRKQVEEVQEFLADAGVPATRYHAGLSADERTRNQRAFVNDDTPVIVATNAFGMGIDKSNVRYVVHFNMPGSLEAYYQEAGRAGRDGEPSVCLLLWNESDIATARFFIEQETSNEALTPEEAETVRSNQRRRLAAMSGYCLTTDCLRATILRYFGDTPGSGESAGLTHEALAVSSSGGSTAGTQTTCTANAADAANQPDSQPSAGAANDTEAAREARGCGNCSNCTEGSGNGAVDVTTTARSVMRCVHELRGRYGKGVVADVLTGSKNARIMQWGLDRKRTYNIVKDSTATVKEVIELLTAGGYLEISEGRYPLVGLGPRCREAATDEFQLYMKRKPRLAKTQVGTNASTGAVGGTGPERGARARGAATLDTAEQRELFERLRALRKRLADDEGVPPYVVFSDATLRGMCASMPRTDDEFLAISGVGQVKLKRYGTAFLDEINRTPDK